MQKVALNYQELRLILTAMSTIESKHELVKHTKKKVRVAYNLECLMVGNNRILKQEIRQEIKKLMHNRVVLVTKLENTDE